MVEKAKFEKKEMAKHVFRCIGIGILVWMLVVGYAFLLMALLVVLWELPYFNNMWLVSFSLVTAGTLGILGEIGIFKVCSWLIKVSKKAMKKKIRNLKFNAKVEEFLSHLGDGEIPVKLKKGKLKDLPEDLKKMRKKKLKLFVSRDGLKSLYISIYKGEKKVDYWITDDYAIFFKYFKPIYGKEEEA